MAGTPRNYILTETAERDFQAARQWSLARWGKVLTRQYFTDLHECAESIVQNPEQFSSIEDVSCTAELNVYPVREHYLVYLPLRDKRIVIVALIRQTRDLPAILNANSFMIQRQLKEVLAKLPPMDSAWDSFSR